MTNSKWSQWFLFLLLCLIWGSSFILMKLGLYTPAGLPMLGPYQVAALRMVSAGVVLIPFAWKAYSRIPDRKTGAFIFLSGIMGSFIPAFLFCLAETKVDSAQAGTLNAMTPIFTLLIATILYKTKIAVGKWVGITIGFAGCLVLFFTKQPTAKSSVPFALLIIVATVCYGFNVNMVRHRLHQVASLDIATLAFVFLLPLSLVVLVSTGFFKLNLHAPDFQMAVLASSVLGVIGTAVASVVFYLLVKKAGIVFASLVTYGIPFVAIGWGFVFKEQITFMQVVALLIILSGVYLANLDYTALRNWLLKKSPGSETGREI